MHPDPLMAGADYAFSVLLEGVSPEVRSRIAYAHPSAAAVPARLVIVPSGFFDPASYGAANSLPRLPLEQIEDLPLLYGTPRVERQGDRLIVHADIVASAFFLLTRYEEVVRREVRDPHGRFPGWESLPGRAGFLDRPLVDEYAALLRKWLREAGVEVPEPARNYSVLLTHDVDSVRRYGAGLLEPARAVAGGYSATRRCAKPWNGWPWRSAGAKIRSTRSTRLSPSMEPHGRPLGRTAFRRSTSSWPTARLTT